MQVDIRDAGLIPGSGREHVISPEGKTESSSEPTVAKGVQGWDGGRIRNGFLEEGAPEYI